MKICSQCGQLLAESLDNCPACGHAVGAGRRRVDGFRILEVLHEGYSSILCRAAEEATGQIVMLRLFTPRSGVDAAIAQRLQDELAVLQRLPEDYFVRHLDIRQARDGLWFRVSEWLEAENWGALVASGYFRDHRAAFALFHRVAAILDGLHRIGHIIPHLILDDIIVFRDPQDRLQVKIDYKLSRFLDPRLDRPGPMLKKLLDTHPDIRQRRPLDVRSAVWSLGKIFLELLSADLETSAYRERVPQLQAPQRVRDLLLAMLADDPDLRPGSLAEVAEILEELLRDAGRPEEAALPAVRSARQQIRSLRRRLGWLTAILAAVGGMVAVLAWLYFRPPPTRSLEELAERYAGSVAFVVADYWLEADGRIAYRNRTEGTAFLVDPRGFLLTNRHVICPWLEDGRLLGLAGALEQADHPPRLGYRIYLWFEGARAFRRLPSLGDSHAIDDIYYVEDAFHTGPEGRLRIAGVAQPPATTGQLVRSPLRDDFAVLQITDLPPGRLPLPLDAGSPPSRISRLAPVMTLGFPLGSRTQEATVNVSVTRGSVRRTFDNLIQVDTSLHRGNSGGPIIDSRGLVIGIASSVAVDMVAAPLPMATLLSDIGMVLPVAGAAAFLKELAAGEPKWDGGLDFAAGRTLEAILDLAAARRWAEARQRARQALETSRDPALIAAAGIAAIWNDDLAAARVHLGQALSMGPRNADLQWMLYLVDWLAGEVPRSPHRATLRALDWRSPAELFGHLVRLLEEAPPPPGDPGLNGDNDGERAWIAYVRGIRAAREGRGAEAEEQMRQAVWRAEGRSWLGGLALAALDRLERQRLDALDAAGAAAYRREVQEGFGARLAERRAAQERRRQAMAPLRARLQHAATPPEERPELLGRLRELDPDDGALAVELAFAQAAAGQWEASRAQAEAFLSRPGRQNAARLGLGLLLPALLHHLGRAPEALERLEVFRRETADGWYRRLAAELLGQEPTNAAPAPYGEDPACLLAAHAARGFWAEAEGRRAEALRHYQEALGSYRDDRPEYAFALERLRRLRQEES